MPETNQKTVEFEAVKRSLFNLKTLTLSLFFLLTWTGVALLFWLVYNQEEQLQQQIITLANQQEELANRPLPQVNTIPPAFQQKLASLEAQLAALANAPRQVDGVLRDALETMKSELQQTRQELEQQDKSGMRSALLVAAVTLRETLRQGQPYAQELDAVRRIAGDDPVMKNHLATLQPSADTGIPRLASLQESFKPALRKALEARPAESNNKATQWLHDNLNQVVQIRRIGKDVEGTTQEAIFARAEAAVEAGNLQKALKELEPLESDALAPWIENAKARVNALSAANGIYRRAITVITN